MSTIRVEAGAGDRGYEVLVQNGLRSKLGSVVADATTVRRWALISDETVAGLHAEPVLEALRTAGHTVELFTFPAGEASKRRGEWSRLTDELLDSGYGRDCGVIGLGGGVTGDLAGFVAATFMRGVPVVQVPTSLLAMIDASVGGKTGVNTKAGKNLVGAFHPPAVVVVDPEFTATLPRATRAEGLAEAIKHGVIRDVAHLAALTHDADALLNGEVEATQTAIRASVAIKAAVVSDDEREAGLRKILNFGHTLGHGVESASAYTLPHGHAVAIGMVAEAQMGEAMGVTDTGTAAQLESAVRRFELPTRVPEGLDPDDVTAAMQADKKGLDGAPHWVPLARIGEAGTEGGPLTLPLDVADARLALFGGGG